MSSASASGSPIHDAEVGDLLPLIGRRVVVFQPRRMSQRSTGGGDIDLLVDQLDPLWPLRLPPDWRLCQVLQYDINGWYWVLDHRGQTVALDTVDDRRGLGRDGLPTQRLIELAESRPDTGRAAYLTAKRIRKSSREPLEWEAISELAGSSPDAYRQALSWVVGNEMAAKLARVVSQGSVPPARLLGHARIAQWVHRRRSLSLALPSLWASAQRWYNRLALPTGMLVVVSGPDGTGKTRLAKDLPSASTGPFRRWTHVHWRPGVLPSASMLIGATPGDPTRPHERASHGTIASLASLAYHWLDFFVGGWVWFAPLKVRSGLIVVERGWLDIAVDPRRYRIAAPQTLVTILGRLLPRPDLVIVLEAAPEVLMARKAEIVPEELIRQTKTWRKVIPKRTEHVYIDAAQPADAVLGAARDAVFSVLARRVAGRLGPGWVGLPVQASPRWLFPRGPSQTALASLSIYQPVTVRARLGWEVAKALASAGCFRVLPRGPGPPEWLRAIVAPYMPPGSTLAVMRANHPGRFLVMVIGPNGRASAIAKVAADEPGNVALDAEARGIEALGKLLEPPLRAPRILARAPGLLLLEAVSWTPRARPWVLPPVVAHRLGRAYARSFHTASGYGMAHGDCAPWNLLRTEDGWVLLDWEEAQGSAPPYFDLFHYVVQAHVLLGRPSLEELAGVKAGRSWVRTAIAAYASGAERSPSSWRTHLVEYLETSMPRLDPSHPDHATALAKRKRLLGLIDV